MGYALVCVVILLLVCVSKISAKIVGAAVIPHGDFAYDPTRGEGWGRPQVEAMAMALPVIATYWGGPLAYMTYNNSFPLLLDGIEKVPDGPFAGHGWAKPSVIHLKSLLREVVTNPQEATKRGEQARQDMVDKYCPRCIAKLVLNRLRIFFKE